MSATTGRKRDGSKAVLQTNSSEQEKCVKLRISNSKEVKIMTSLLIGTQYGNGAKSRREFCRTLRHRRPHHDRILYGKLGIHECGLLQSLTKGSEFFFWHAVSDCGNVLLTIRRGVCTEYTPVACMNKTFFSQDQITFEKPKLDNAHNWEEKTSSNQKIREVQAHNESRSEKVGSSDASSKALQNTDEEQWWTHRSIGKRKNGVCLCCWCRRKLEFKSWGELDTNLTKITSLKKGWILWIMTVLFTNSFRCLKQRKFQMQRQQWWKKWKHQRKFRHDSWRKSKTRKGDRWSND